VSAYAFRPGGVQALIKDTTTVDKVPKDLCRDCKLRGAAVLVFFDVEIITGRLIAFNPDGTPHPCPNP